MAKLINILFFLFIANIFPQGVIYFNGHNAMEYLNKQCDIGPRYPGSKGHAEAVKLYKEHFSKYSNDVRLLEGYAIHPHSLDSIKLINVFSRFNIHSPNRILLMAHYDTREYADQDLDKNNHNKPIIGANDGASGVSILMELAKFFHENPLNNLGIDILLTDGEDMGLPGDEDSWGIGAKLFSHNLPETIPMSAICIDMVGDKELALPMEPNSYIQAPELVLAIWGLAKELGYDEFQMKFGRAIIDDHSVLYKHTKIPSIDIIDFEYPNSTDNYWHTIEDTPDKCSARSLEIVGTVLVNYLYRLDMEINGR